MQALRDHFIARQHELLALTCALVETESPSGDKEASGAIASLVASAAATISAVDSIERRFGVGHQADRMHGRGACVQKARQILIGLEATTRQEGGDGCCES